jgi:uncharacterized LabA/DUF88 family protein
MNEKRENSVKTVVLVDGPYLVANLRVLPMATVDFAKFMSFLKERYRPLLKAVFYVATQPGNERQGRFITLLRDIGYQVRTFDIQQHGDTRVGRGLDVQLAVDILQWAESCDRVVLVSGDADFVPAMLTLPHKGVVGELLAFRASLSSELRRSVHNFVDLLELLPDILLDQRKGKKMKADPSPDIKPLDPDEALITRAALAGIKLERKLRALCSAKGHTTNVPEGLDALNNRLARDGTYDKLTKKKIIVWAEIRNKAAHGLPPNYTSHEIELMEKGIEQLLKTLKV